LPPLPLPLLLRLRLLPPPLPDFFPPLLEEPGLFEIAAARLLLIPFLRRPSYCLSFLTLEPWSFAMSSPRGFDYSAEYPEDDARISETIRA
jgi:hypothetical protein